MQICVDSPIPTIDSILRATLPKIPYPPSPLHLPASPPVLPCIPNPTFKGRQLPTLEMVTMAFELQAFQLQTTLLNMIKPILSFLGMGIDSFLPKIPGIGLTLLDLIAGTPDKIVAAFKAAIERGFQWPGLPTPFFPSISIPSFQIIQTMQHVIGNYMQALATAVVGLIEKVTSKLKIPMISFPKMPTPEEILAMVLGGLPSLDALLNKFRKNIAGLFALLSSITFPGFPPMPMLPVPLIPNFHLPDIELKMGLIALMNSLAQGLMKPIMDFILNTLSKYLGFSFPKICITI